jgi:hypothetical protein
MRTIEAIGSGRKLITTNTSIVNYDIYSKDNILLIDRKNPIILRDFLESPFNPLSNLLQDRYSITGWLKDLLVDEAP